MRRIRGAAWAILLWLVVVVLYAITTFGESDTLCVITLNDTTTACAEDVWLAVVAGAFGVLFLIGAVLLLFTKPDGTGRAFLVRIMVNTLALFLTLGLLGIVSLPTTLPDGSSELVPLLQIPSGLIVVGTLFALVNVLVRPVLFAIFGRWILRTVGLAVIVVNALLFWLVAQISAGLGDPWVTPDPRLVWLVVDSIVFTVVLTIVDAFLGLDRPRPLADEGGRLWRLLDTLPARRRSAIIESIRLQQVYETISAYGLEIVAGGTALAPVRRLGDMAMGRTSDGLDALSTPGKVRVMLQQLGPTFVKIGQMASSRADALPEEWRAELDKLQSTVPPFPWEQARAIITTELGGDPETLFASIEHEPFGAASLAQVHRATLHVGRLVVVKIPRPDVQAKVRADLGVIMQLAEVAEARVATARQMDVTGLAREFADGVLEELDYRVEAYHARRLADVVRSIDGVRVPEIHGALSTSRVLVMDFVPGVKATQADRLDPSLDREAIARTFMRSMIKQVMVEGFFHADPHPGNVMLDTQTGVLTFLDLGLVGQLEQQQRFDLIALLWALQIGDPGALASVALRLCRATGPVDEGAFRTAVERLYYQYWIYGNASFSRMMSALFATLREQNLRMRSELTLAVKAITQAEELMRAMDPSLKLVEVATQEAETLLRDELTPERVARIVRGQVAGALQSAFASVADGGTPFGPLILDALTGGRLGLAAASSSASAPVDLGPLLERVDTVGDRVDRLGRRLLLVAGAAGLAIALALSLLAIVLAPGIDQASWLLVVTAALVVTAGWLGWTLFRERGASGS
jgi:ubiquinone biosynthesis protein